MGRRGVDEAHHGDAPAAAGHDLVDRGEVVAHEAGAQQQILGRVAGDGELGQGQHVAPLRLGLAHHLEDAGDVAGQVADDGVDLGQAHPDGWHRRNLGRVGTGAPTPATDRALPPGPSLPGVTGTSLPPELEPLVEHSAAPVAVRAALENLVDAAPATIERLTADPELAATTVAVMAASRSLTRTIDADPVAATEVLAGLDHRPPVDDVSPEALLAWRNLEFLRIAARDLSGRDPLEEVGAALAALVYSQELASDFKATGSTTLMRRSRQLHHAIGFECAQDGAHSLAIRTQAVRQVLMGWYGW